MKLLNKTIFYYLIISLPVLIILSALSYRMIWHDIRHGINESLERELTESKKLINKNPFSTTHYLSADGFSKIIPIKKNNYKTGYSDTLIFDKTAQENISFRRLVTVYNFQNQLYLIIIYKAEFEAEELVEGIFKTFFVLIISLVISFLIINWFLTKTIWRPFYRTLRLLDYYDIKKHNEYYFATTHIKEFNQLNSSLNKLTSKVHKDYLQQKEFTENASHELQTPIAVAKASLDLLMQSQNIKEGEMEQIQILEKIVNKMSALNKTLILLTRIENNQFKELENIDLKEALNRTITSIEEQSYAKQISIKIDVKDVVSVKANTLLIDILLSNLFQNAIRYNIEGGEIKVFLSNKNLTISNTGHPLPILPEELFMRFKKSNTSKDSLGLGLSIVKGIIDLYEYKINYSYKNNEHIFMIEFI